MSEVVSVVIVVLVVMGIVGLLPFLKKASRQVSLREFQGKTAAVDVYCWLHKVRKKRTSERMLGTVPSSSFEYRTTVVK